MKKLRENDPSYDPTFAAELQVTWTKTRRTRQANPPRDLGAQPSARPSYVPANHSFRACWRTTQSAGAHRRHRVPKFWFWLILTDSVIWIVLEHPSIKYIQVLSSIIHLAGFGSWMHWNSIEFHRIPSSGFLLVLGRSDTCIDLLSWSWHLKTMEFNHV
jgi:hypothetical protein